MDTEFNKWLVEKNLLKKIKNNPDLENELFNTFQRVYFFKDIDTSVEWFTHNYDFAQKQYPEFYNIMVEAAKNLTPIELAISIDKIPSFIPDWLIEANKALPIQRKKRLEQIKELLILLIQTGVNTTTEIIKAAYENNKVSINEGLAIIEKELQNTNSSFVITGFQSTLTPLQIETLFEQLKDSYIDKNTNPDYFKAIFKNEPLPDSFKPIKRLKPFTVVLCAYFISELFQKENPNDYWSIAENCFDKTKANILKNSLRNAYEYNPYRKPKGYKEIDTILKNIYTPLQ